MAEENGRIDEFGEHLMFLKRYIVVESETFERGLSEQLKDHFCEFTFEAEHSIMEKWKHTRICQKANAGELND